MGDRDDRAREAREELLQPFDRLGIEMVGRFVEQQHVRLRQQQLAQRDATLLATGELADDGIPRRQAQRVGGHFELLLQGIGIACGQDRLEAFLFLGQCIEIRAFVGIGGIDRLELVLGFKDFTQRRLDFLAHRLLGIELRFLLQITDLDARCRPRLAVEVLVDAGHDAQHGRLAGAVQAQQADLRARKETQRNVLDDFAFRGNDLAHPVHGVDVLHGLGLIRQREDRRLSGYGCGKSSAARPRV